MGNGLILQWVNTVPASQYIPPNTFKNYFATDFQYPIALNKDGYVLLVAKSGDAGAVVGLHKGKSTTHYQVTNSNSDSPVGPVTSNPAVYIAIIIGY